MRKYKSATLEYSKVALLQRYQSHTFTAKPPLKKQVFAQYLIGGAEGSRTPVRKHFLRIFSGRRRLLRFPRPVVSRHTLRGR